MKLKKMLFVFGICFLISCNKENIKKEYYPNGKVRLQAEVNEKGIYNGLYQEFYEDGAIKSSTYYDNGIIVDTVFYYHKNGVIASKGFSQNYQPIGWWSHYDVNGNLQKKREILKINDELFLNQEIKYDNNKNIDYSRSSFFKLNIKDTLFLGGSIGEIMYYPDTIGYNKRFIRIIVDNQYSDELIKKDTFGGYDDKNWFGIYNHRIGKKTISGIIEQDLIYKRNHTFKDSSGYFIETRKKYFKKEVYIKDTIQ